MRSITSQLALVLAGTILLGLLAVLATSRPEYCGPVDAPRSHAQAAKSISSQAPTLAPQQNVVVVQVESDRPDIEIGWAEN
jgi:hypothetical protein